MHEREMLLRVHEAEQRASDQLLPRKGRGKVRDWSGTRWASDRLLPRVAKRGCSQRRLDGKVEPDQQNRAPTVLKTPTSGRGCCAEHSEHRVKTRGTSTADSVSSRPLLVGRCARV